MVKIKYAGVFGLGLGLALASGCISRGQASFGGAGELEPDMTIPTGENPMPAALAPQQPGNVIYPEAQPPKAPEYWQEHADPYAELSQGRPYVGQGFTIAPPVSAKASGSSTYVVRQGDIFGKIAAKHNVTVKALKAANPGIDYDRIKIGQKLNIPGKTAASASADKSSGSSGVHVVKKGEIFGKIAGKYNVTVKALKAANPGIDYDRIKVGQKLNIPGKTAAAKGSSAPAQTKATPAPAPKAEAQTIKVAPPTVSTDVPELPEIPSDTGVKEEVTAGAAPLVNAAKEAAGAETTVYLANGEEDLFTIAVNRTMSIAQLLRLNPNLESPTKILPAGTPVIVPAAK
ncbi:MAG: LysM peptidoglycan-binding domain-containing protein [Kiritimatiellae bacterium]|nr:LysM peptidoglycan-binding domain-containing protein [Kiritimatiellia bacterium]